MTDSHGSNEAHGHGAHEHGAHGHGAHGHGAHGHAQPLSHVMDLPTLFGVAAALLVLTAVTVSAANLQLGSWDVVVAMGIATVKALLVLIYFMHLRYEKPFTTLSVVFSVIFVALFLGFALLDSWEYQGYIVEYMTSPYRETSSP